MGKGGSRKPVFDPGAALTVAVWAGVGLALISFLYQCARAFGI